ncbi:hypothetical protein L6R52_28185 [Myxococcota bacterium]|nr:hypothetical protein [Myxococcota bacterium]
MVKKTTNPTTAPMITTLDELRAAATSAAADGKLSAAEKRSLASGLQTLDRSGQQAALEFLRGESKVLAQFARSDATARRIDRERVGGDQGLDRFLDKAGALAGPGANGKKQGLEGYSATERSELVGDYRALSKADQRAAVERLRADGKERLATSLEQSLVAPKDAEPTKSRAEFDAALATALAPGKNGKPGRGLEGLSTNERGRLVRLFRGLSEADRQGVVDALKNERPRLAVQLDRIQNARPMPTTPFGALGADVVA